MTVTIDGTTGVSAVQSGAVQVGDLGSYWCSNRWCDGYSNWTQKSYHQWRYASGT